MQTLIPLGTYFAIVTCRNSEANIERTLLSIKTQTIVPEYVIVIDDGSTDDTPTLLASYGDRLKWARQENQGEAAAVEARDPERRLSAVGQDQPDDVEAWSHWASATARVYARSTDPTTRARRWDDRGG